MQAMTLLAAPVPVRKVYKQRWIKCTLCWATIRWL